MQSPPLYAFGAFELDPARRRLSRGAEPVALSDRQFEVLLLLVERSGHIVAKDDLIAAAWKDVAVSDNSLEQVISSLRRLLGQAPGGSPYIETLARRGYRFSAEVARTVVRQTDEALDALLAPHKAFLEGRAALETLEHDAIAHARQAFGEAVIASPDYASAHVGLANALALQFEATRADDAPDIQALLSAVGHAREACRLDPESGEAWATLAFVLSRAGAGTEPIAAGRRAVALERDNWRHHLRLAYVAWGEERLRAARQTAKLLPGLGFAHWLAASVHVARQAFPEAERELTVGVLAQDEQQEGARFPSVGLHLLLGLVRLARGDEGGAEAEFGRELGFESAGHIYARQAAANTWCAIGAIRLTQARRHEALSAFEAALTRVPGHLLGLAALAAAADSGRDALGVKVAKRIATLEAYGATVEAAMARAVAQTQSGNYGEAGTTVQTALQSAAPGSSAGWTIPVEPLLQVRAHPDAWAGVLALLRNRAA